MWARVDVLQCHAAAQLTPASSSASQSSSEPSSDINDDTLAFTARSTPSGDPAPAPATKWMRRDRLSHTSAPSPRGKRPTRPPGGWWEPGVANCQAQSAPGYWRCNSRRSGAPTSTQAATNTIVGNHCIFVPSLTSCRLMNHPSSTSSFAGNKVNKQRVCMARR